MDDVIHDFVNHPQHCLIVVDDKPVYTISHIGFVAQCDVARSSPDIVVGWAQGVWLIEYECSPRFFVA